MSFYIWSSPYSTLITRKLRWKSYEIIIFSSSTYYQTHCSSSQQPTMSNSLEYLGFILKNFLVQKRNWFPHHLSFCPKCILAQKKFAYFRFTKERQQKSWPRRRGNFGSIPYFGSLKINLTQRVRALEKSFFIIFGSLLEKPGPRKTSPILATKVSDMSRQHNLISNQPTLIFNFSPTQQ